MILAKGLKAIEDFLLCGGVVRRGPPLLEGQCALRSVRLCFIGAGGVGLQPGGDLGIPEISQHRHQFRVIDPFAGTAMRTDGLGGVEHAAQEGQNFGPNLVANGFAAEYILMCNERRQLFLRGLQFLGGGDDLRVLLFEFLLRDRGPDKK